MSKYKMTVKDWIEEFIFPSYNTPLPLVVRFLRWLMLYPFFLIAISSVLGLIMFAIFYIGLNIWWLLEWVYDVINVLLGY